MYTIQDIAARIRDVAKKRNITIKQMLSDCKLGVNALSNMDSGRALSSTSLAKIAEYLDVSVDYLLGRTNVPNHNLMPELEKLMEHTSEDANYMIIGFGGKAEFKTVRISEDDIQTVKKMLEGLDKSAKDD